MRTHRLKPRNTKSGSISASVLGIVVFLAGVGLLAFTFNLAHTMFSVPVETALDADKKPTLDPAVISQSLIGIVKQVLLLVIMGLMGSLIANRGISLFAGSLTGRQQPKGSEPRRNRAEESRAESIPPQSGASQK